MPRQQGFRDARGELTRSRILAAITAKPLTANQICAVVHRAKPTVCRHLAILMAEPRQIRICGHQPPPGRGLWSELYGIGSGPDKAFHGPETRQARWKKEKSKTEQLDRYNARRRATNAIARHTAKPNGPFAALGL